MYVFLFKRLIDISVAATLLVLVSPVLVSLSVILVISNRGKPFFFQNRPGKNGVLFRVIKFKTMNDKRDSMGNLLKDSERITRVGRLVRSTSLDEIPQLFNVLKGEMSLVGPRPLLIQYLPLYNDQQARRHEVRPGITGWAQVNGRNSISWEQRFTFDLYYVDNVSLSLDMKILFLTIKKVFMKEGINSAKDVTMEAFKGNRAK
ncbi:MAG: sugar transferase [Imperialibacter sp.]|uniref:sugar transferase n=1 Tax=Imperialibacter sp. TaxID=2038411 RepID=UPI0032EFECE2